MTGDIVHNVLVNKNADYNPNYLKKYKYMKKTWKEIYLNINYSLFVLWLYREFKFSFFYFFIFSKFFTVFMNWVGNKMKNKLNV